MIEVPNLQRHPSDPNIWITHEHHHNGMPLMWQHAPFVYNYLNRIDQTIQTALTDHASVMAVRVDLRFPGYFDGKTQPFNRHVFSRFIDSLRARIKTRQKRSEREGKRFHPTNVHYIWVREFGEEGQPHYHCVLMFNKQTFLGLGNYASDDPGSLAGMIKEAWASALGLNSHLTHGLVHFARNGTYWVKRSERYDALFERASYCAKVSTKGFGLATHSFGASTVRYG